VVLAHAGGQYKSPTEATGEIIDETAEMNRFVDMVVAGHSHSFLNNRVNGKLIIEAFSFGTAFDQVNMKVDRRTGEVVTTYNDEAAGVAPDPETAALVASYDEQITPIENRVVGTAATTITRTADADGESALGDLIADAQREYARVGQTIRVSEVVSGDGAPLVGGTGVVNGGPRLVEGGTIEITAFAEGFVYPENPEFYYRFGERRNPRTLAGVTRGGDLLLVAVDGRRPGYSVGVSFEESAAIMDVLGSREAVNLDGGGSTGMTLGRRLVTRPSDPTGERPIGDAVVLR
jgi:2',3'-cyclic-nucleotide 2'-phosphodiesterase (5'-nucleotidase family)